MKITLHSNSAAAIDAAKAVLAGKTFLDYQQGNIALSGVALSISHFVSQDAAESFQHHEFWELPDIPFTDLVRRRYPYVDQPSFVELKIDFDSIAVIAGIHFDHAGVNDLNELKSQFAITCAELEWLVGQVDAAVSYKGRFVLLNLVRGRGN